MVVAWAWLAGLRREGVDFLHDLGLRLHDGVAGVRADRVGVLALARVVAAGVARVAVLVLLERVEVVHRPRLGRLPSTAEQVSKKMMIRGWRQVRQGAMPRFDTWRRCVARRGKSKTTVCVLLKLQ